MTKIDLTALLNRPRYGSAAKALIEGGAWDATANGGTEYTVNMIVTVKVSASSANEARENAFAEMDYTDVKHTQVFQSLPEAEYK